MEEGWILLLGPMSQVKRPLLSFLDRNSDVTEAHFDQNAMLENRKRNEQNA